MKVVHLDAMQNSRKLKPSIPKKGHFGIPMKHEVEFEKELR